MRAHILDLFFEVRNVRANFAPINFELAFAGTAQADAAGAAASRRPTRLAREVRPHARQSRQAILVLREFDLERAFFGTRMLRENIEDERGAVEHLDVLALECRFDFALLVGREFVVENQHIERRVGARGDDLVQFTFADHRRGIDAVNVLHGAPDNLQARRFRKPFQFAERIVNRKFVAWSLQFHADEKRAFDGRLSWDG